MAYSPFVRNSLDKNGQRADHARHVGHPYVDLYWPARAAAIGIFSTSAGVGMAAGPVLAGFLLDNFWWGSVFLINVPVAALALVGLAVLVPNFRSPTLRPLDPAGMLLSVSGLVALAYGLIRAGQVAVWSRTDVWAPIVVGLVLLAVFVLVELRVKMPSFDPRLLAQRTFGGGNVALGLLLFAVAAITFYNAFYCKARSDFADEGGFGQYPDRIRRARGGRSLARAWFAACRYARSPCQR